MSLTYQNFPIEVVKELTEHNVNLLDRYFDEQGPDVAYEVGTTVKQNLENGEPAVNIVEAIQELYVFPLAKKAIKEETQKRIDRGWWTVVGVMGDGETPPFNYTVGLGGVTGREITLSGISPETATSLINTLGEYLKDNPTVAVEDIDCQFGALRDGTPLRYRIEQRPLLTVVDEYAYQIEGYYEITPEMTMLIVVLPDANNCLPGEDEYDEGFRQLTNETLEGVYHGRL